MAGIKDYLGKGWRFPVDVDRSGGVSTSQMEENIQNAILIILGTAPGERLMRLEFGCHIHNLLFDPNTPTTRSLAAFYCEEALMKWEPRITKVKAQARTTPDQPNTIIIDIQYTILANSTSRNMVYPFYLQKHEER
jgi:uncharacterized protein